MYDSFFFSAPQLKRDPLGSANPHLLSAVSTFQLLGLAALALGAAVYVWRGVKRGMQADAVFFAELVQQLSPLLEAKGFRLTRNVYMAKSFGHRIATFEGPSCIVDAAWDGRDRDILLLQRAPDQSNVSAGERLAEAHIPQGAAIEVYARATERIVTVAASIGRSLTSA